MLLRVLCASWLGANSRLTEKHNGGIYKMGRFGEKVKTNGEVYKSRKEALDAWAEWSRRNKGKIVMFSEWMEMPYEGK